MTLAALATAIPDAPAPQPVERRFAMRLRVRYPDGSWAILLLDANGFLHVVEARYQARTCPLALWLLPVAGCA